MSGFALLWGKILESSLWVQESKETRLVWITLLAMKDKDGVIQASEIGLADRAKVTPGECREALRVLASPDPNDSSKVEQGRRIREIPGGWQIINHDLYRFSTEARRLMWRETKAAQRAVAKPKRAGKMGLKAGPLPGEAGYLAAERAGASEAELDRLAAPVVPSAKERELAVKAELIASANSRGDEVTVRMLEGKVGVVPTNPGT